MADAAERDMGGLHEVEIIAVPWIGLDDAPFADQGAFHVPRHGGASASSLGVPAEGKPFQRWRNLGMINT